MKTSNKNSIKIASYAPKGNEEYQIGHYATKGVSTYNGTFVMLNNNYSTPGTIRKTLTYAIRRRKK